MADWYKLLINTLSKQGIWESYTGSQFLNLCWWCAKNCKNWWMCVKPIAGQTWDIFFETHCRCSRHAELKWRMPKCNVIITATPPTVLCIYHLLVSLIFVALTKCNYSIPTENQLYTVKYFKMYKKFAVTIQTNGTWEVCTSSQTKQNEFQHINLT